MQLHDDTRKLFGYDEVSMKECEYQATQIFYTNEPLNAQEMDQITAVEYSRDGEHLAVGDRGGRIWIYSTNDGRNKCKPKPFNAFIQKYEDDFKSDALHSSRATSAAHQRSSNGVPETEEEEEEVDEDDDIKDSVEEKDVLKRGLVYDFYGQFQSHQPEFDYLKSLEIEEKINCISWCRCANNSLSLLACNDKTIKLWKVFEKSMYRQSGSSFHKKFKTSSVANNDYQFSNVSLPQIECDDIITAAISRRVYQNGHKFHIHSLDVNCDCETFISADDLRINLWHFDTPSTSFNLCDLKPDSMENLTNTITKAILHPLHCNYMAYTTSQSQICFCDMRQNCQIRNNNTLFIDNYEQYNPSQIIKNGNNMYQFASTKVFQYQQPLIHRDFFTDLASYISGITFTKDGNCMIVRDYFNAYVWDIRNNEKPLKIIPVHPYYANDMKHLYESDLLFDKFKVVSSPNSMSLATGTYNNSFVVANYETQQIQKCVLNANQVVAFQNKLKKNQKKLKKLKKLNKLKQKQKQQEKQSAASMMDVDQQPIGKDVNNADREMERERDRDEERERDRDKEKDREHDSKKRQQQQQTLQPQQNEEEEEVVLMKPSWLQSSYFQKGNFDQKTLHLSWHPKKDVIAAVSGSQLLIFQKL